MFQCISTMLSLWSKMQDDVTGTGFCKIVDHRWSLHWAPNEKKRRQYIFVTRQWQIVTANCFQDHIF
jgi:hypothetical protein